MVCKKRTQRAAGLACLAFAALLSGCVAPPPYDMDSVPVAMAQQRASSDECYAKARAQQITKFRQFTDCQVVGLGQFVQTIKLKQMEYFTAYTQRMNILGDEEDAGTIPQKDFVPRMTNIERDFVQTLGAAYKLNQTEHTKAAAALSAFGKAMSDAGQAMQPPPPAYAPQPAPLPSIQPPITCTTQRTSPNWANTTCY